MKRPFDPDILGTGADSRSHAGAWNVCLELAEPDSSPHVLRIRKEKSLDVVATVHAVPVKRKDSSGDIVLRFNEQGAPVALRAYFYPNSMYGHQFVYDDTEARDIASRTKTIVLTMEQPDKDGRSGTN